MNELCEDCEYELCYDCGMCDFCEGCECDDWLDEDSACLLIDETCESCQ